MGDIKLEFGWSKLPGDLQKRWPRDESGEFVAPKFLAWRQCVDLADEFLVNMLEAYGIPVLRQYAGDGSFGKVVLGMSGTGAELLPTGGSFSVRVPGLRGITLLTKAQK